MNSGTVVLPIFDSAVDLAAHTLHVWILELDKAARWPSKPEDMNMMDSRRTCSARDDVKRDETKPCFISPCRHIDLPRLQQTPTERHRPIHPAPPSAPPGATPPPPPSPSVAPGATPPRRAPPGHVPATAVAAGHTPRPPPAEAPAHGCDSAPANTRLRPRTPLFLKFCSSTEVLNVHTFNFSLDDLRCPSTSTTSCTGPQLKACARSWDFQKKWSQLALSFSQECSLTPQGATSLTNHQSLIRHMQGNNIQCVASGGKPPNYKLFFYGQKAGAAPFYLVECNVNTTSAKAQLKIKAYDGTTAEAFSALFQSVLSQFGHS